LYNETNGVGIFPTPVIGGVGMIANASNAVGFKISKPNCVAFLVGSDGSHLGQSLFLREALKREDGDAPHVDLKSEKQHGDFVRAHILNGTIHACHDVSDGGVAIALAELLMANNIGFRVASDLPTTTKFWFGEDQARYVVVTDQPEQFIKAISNTGIPHRALGSFGGSNLDFGNNMSLSVRDLILSNEEWLPRYMSH
jgi:phosphoribosylformylglycinamidine synthase